MENNKPVSKLTLKWGTLKGWDALGDKEMEIMRRYNDLGTAMGAAQQNDTPEQKQLICELIDACGSDTVHLDWDGIDVSREEAKKYVMDYK